MAFSTIIKPTDYFNTLLYSGNSTARSLTGVGFEPSWVWIKERTSTSDHMLFDQPRGVQKYISSNLTNAEQTSAGMLTAFGSDGFSLGNGNDVNDNGQTYASWNWKANGAGSSNTDGSITSTVSASTISGFSIVKYTGNDTNSTVGHGLGKVPKTIMVKQLNGSNAWRVYTEATGNTSQGELNDGASFDSGNTSMWNSTTPTSSVFSIGTHGSVNGGSDTYIAYCFADVQGFSKIGSYVGNGQGNANGTFVYTGFKPAFVLIKNADFNSNWNNFTGDIPGYNQINDTLQPNLSSAENGTFAFDMLSNGFKHRSGDVMDRDGDTHIYMAFAAAPLVGTNNVPANAR